MFSVIFVLFLFPVLVRGQYSALVDLGIAVTPNDINDSGTIVGSRDTGAGTIGCVVYAGSSSCTDIMDTRYAHAVNNHGVIVGTTVDGGAFSLDDKSTKTTWSGFGAFGSNDLGEISGNKALNNTYRSSPLPLDPAIYTRNHWECLGIAITYRRGTRDGVYADLYTLNDINDGDIAVGIYRKYGIVGSSAIYTDENFTKMNFLFNGYASAINNHNLIVGATGSPFRGFSYDLATGVSTDLGTLNGGYSSFAKDINDLNVTVGGYDTRTALTSLWEPWKTHAFVHEGGTMQDLNNIAATLIATEGWEVLSTATAINNNGDIVGTGFQVDAAGNRVVHGFLLTAGTAPPPPPPSPTPPPPVENQPPVAAFTVSSRRFKASEPATFEASGSYDPDGTITRYEWDFGDGTTGSGQYVDHTYTTKGRYTVVLTVTDDDGDTDSASKTIRFR